MNTVTVIVIFLSTFFYSILTSQRTVCRLYNLFISHTESFRVGRGRRPGVVAALAWCRPSHRLINSSTTRLATLSSVGEETTSGSTQEAAMNINCSDAEMLHTPKTFLPERKKEINQADSDYYFEGID